MVAEAAGHASAGTARWCDMLQRAEADELEAVDFYTRLMEAAASRDVRDVIWSIREDERKHAELLRRILQRHC
ncbi:MAG: hypothetical protein IRY95_01830 [Clostridia bacterium]|nr:hypothetical protein [Clostridia bacterium]